MEALPKWNVERKNEYSEPSLLSTYTTSYSYFLSNLHCFHCNSRDLYFVNNCWMDSKLLGCMAMRPFSNMLCLSSYFFPNKDSRFSQASFGVLSHSRWNKRSQEIWVHMKLKASSNRFKNLLFSTCCWGSISLPIVILYKPRLGKDTCISSLQYK